MQVLPILLTALAATTGFDSKTPPAGAPWKTDFLAAHKEATATGKPIFAYFTKTFCPHCVPVEQNVLPHEGLKPLYDKVVWLYVFNDFSGSEKDRHADRIRARYGVSSWPQLLLMDPATGQVVQESGRTVEDMLRDLKLGADKVKKPTNPEKVIADMLAADQLASKLQVGGTPAEARPNLSHKDFAVRAIAVEVLLKNDPDSIVPQAAKLLDTPNDTFRYNVCNSIVKAKTLPKDLEPLRAKMEALLEKPTGSRNPNVLRSHLCTALARVGDVESLSPLNKLASTGLYLNTTTGVAAKAVGEIGVRDSAAKAKAISILCESFPKMDPDAGARMNYLVGLAKIVYEQLERLTGLKPGFPAQYSEKARESLRSAFLEGFSR